MADYDAGEVTERERLAAERQKEIARANANALAAQLESQLTSYTDADIQNRRLANNEIIQNRRKAETDRFEAQRNLQNATIGLLGSLGGSGMNGSAVGNLLRMLENRNDADNDTYWEQLQANNNTVWNAYEESANQNQMARQDAVTNAAKATRDIESDLAANLNNINPNLYEAPGTGSADFGAGKSYTQGGVLHSFAPRRPELSGYLMPQDYLQESRRVAPRNKLGGNDYFSTMMNRFNRRY